MRFSINLAFSTLKTLVIWGVVTAVVYLGANWLQAGVTLNQFLSALGGMGMFNVYGDAMRDLFFWQVGLAALALLALLDKCLLVIASLLMLDDEQQALSSPTSDEWSNL